MTDKKARPGKFRVIGDEWPNMETPIFGGDFDTLDEARVEANVWNGNKNTRTSMYNDAGEIVG